MVCKNICNNDCYYLKIDHLRAYNDAKKSMPLLLINLLYKYYRMGGMEKRMSALENRVEAMAEDVAITRSATNTLLKWTERTDSIVNVGLYE